MHDAAFDPYEDRLARDIRNELSRSFMNSLDGTTMLPARETAERFLAMDIASSYHDYIEKRLITYEHAIRIIKEQKISDPLKQSLLLWDLNLFFEVHERLEGLWMHAPEPQRQALQGLIQAAGVFIHLAHGHETAAETMAAKALKKLLEHGKSLHEFAAAEKLIAALSHNNPVPPKLTDC